jgi:hypothetical protein
MYFILPFNSFLNPFERSATAVAPLSTLEQGFHGKDLVFVGSKVFLYSRSSYLQFLSIFFKLATTLISGFFSELVLVGLGFRLIKIGGAIFLKLGHSHYIKVFIPSGLYILGYKKKIVVFGVRPCDVNQLVERLVSFRKPDVYKNKGVQVVGRTFCIKIGKQK